MRDPVDPDAGHGRAAREQLVRAGRRLEAAGLVVATDGNLSVRLDRDRMLITPAGCRLGQLAAADLVECEIATGAVLRAPNHGRPSSEWRLHAAAYRSRDTIGAVVHAHPLAAVALSVAGIEPAFASLPEATIGIGRVLTLPCLPPGSEELARAVGAATREYDALLLACHGAVTCAEQLEQAVWRMERLAWSARVLALAHLLRGAAPPAGGAGR